jgi:hypothetical protein
VNRFIDHLQVVTTNNYNTTDFHTTNLYTRIVVCPLPLVFIWQQLSTMAIPLPYFLVTHLHNGDSSASVARWLTSNTQHPTAPYQSQVTLRLAVYSQSVRLGDKPLETHVTVFFQLNTYGHNPYVTSSIMRGWVCRLQLLLALASADETKQRPREGRTGGTPVGYSRRTGHTGSKNDCHLPVPGENV